MSNFAAKLNHESTLRGTDIVIRIWDYRSLRTKQEGQWRAECKKHGEGKFFKSQNEAWTKSRTSTNICAACALGTVTFQTPSVQQPEANSVQDITKLPLTVSNIRLLAENLMKQHNVDNIPLVFTERTSRRLGAVFFRRNLVTNESQPVKLQLSGKLLAHTSWDQVTDTILHEIAHIHAGHDAGHGPAWQAAAMRIGATPKACAENVVPASAHKHTATCAKCGHEVGFDRMTKNWREERYMHKKCGGRFLVSK